MVRRVAPWAKSIPGKDWGYRYLYSIAQGLDLLIEQGLEAARLQFPTACPPEALPYHGRDRGVRRAPGESRASYEARLLVWRTSAKKAGSAFAILSAIQSYALGTLGSMPSVTLVTNTGTWFVMAPDGTIERTVSLPGPSNWDWDTHPELWDRFWIVLYASEWQFGDPPQPWERDGTWGDGELWGNDGSSTIGSTATPDQVIAIRQLIADSKGDDQLCVSVVISFDDTAFKPDSSGTLPDGLWKNHGKRDGSGNVVVARSEDALYWDGVS